MPLGVSFLKVKTKSHYLDDDYVKPFGTELSVEWKPTPPMEVMLTIWDRHVITVKLKCSINLQNYSFSLDEVDSLRKYQLNK